MNCIEYGMFGTFKCTILESEKPALRGPNVKCSKVHTLNHENAFATELGRLLFGVLDCFTTLFSIV